MRREACELTTGKSPANWERRRRLLDAPPAPFNLAIYFWLWLFSARTGCSRSARLAVLGSPVALRGGGASAEERSAGGLWAAGAAPGPWVQGRAGAGSRQGPRPGFGEVLRARRAPEPRALGEGAGAVAQSAATWVASGFYPSLLLQAALPSVALVLAVKLQGPSRGWRRRNRGWEEGEPEDNGLPQRRKAMGQPEGQRHLRVKARPTNSAWSRG